MKWSIGPEYGYASVRAARQARAPDAFDAFGAVQDRLSVGDRIHPIASVAGAVAPRRRRPVAAQYGSAGCGCR